MDGTHYRSCYKQNFSQTTNKSQDSEIFTSYLWPLDLISQSQILIKNESLGDSTKCRTLLILYEEETLDLTITDSNKLEKAFDMPTPIKISL